MKKAIFALWMMCALPAFADVTTAQLQAFLKEEPRSWEPELGEVYDLVSSAPKDVSLQAASRALSAQWSITPEAAHELVEAVVLSKDEKIDYRAREKEVGKHFDAAERLAPASEKAWALIVDFRRDQLGCSDELRDQHLDKPFIMRPTFILTDCDGWAPEFYRRHPDNLAGRFLVIDRLESQDVLGALAVARTLVSALEAPGANLPAPWRRAASWRYWNLLGKAGLGGELLADVAARPRHDFRALPRDDFRALLEAEAAALVMDGLEIDSAKAEEDRRDAAATAWLWALIEAGRLDEARAIDAKYGNDLTQDVLRGTPEGDLFDAYVGDGRDRPGLLALARQEGFIAMRLVSRFLASNRFDSAASSLRRALCQDRTGEVMPAPEQLPVDYREARAKFSRLLKEQDTAAGCGARGDHGALAMSSKLERLPEIALSDAEKALPLRPGYEDKLPLPASFEPVRVERQGPEVVAVCLSGAADPGGEVSRGGYWLLRSKDGGGTWSNPLYLGFQMHQPYVVKTEGRLPMLMADTLRLEVDVEELDPESITFPPIALRSRREAHGLYVTIPFETLERDRDGDGLTDLLEARLRTDPAKADTDGDGLSDRFDDFPQVSARAEPHALAPIVVDLLKKLMGYERAGIVEPMRKGGDSLDLLLRDRHAASAGSLLFTFIEGDAALFRGLRVDGQVIVLAEEEVRDLRARYGPMFPLSFPDILVSPDGTRAMVEWSAGWTGGTYLYRKVKGRWVAKDLGQWITHRRRPEQSGGAILMRELS